MVFLLIVAALVSAGIVWVVVNANKAAKENQQLHDRTLADLSNVEGFTPAITHLLSPLSYGLSLDPATERFAIIIPGHQPRLYHFSQLVAAEVERNGTTITTTKGKVSMGGAAVATALVGPLGLLMGAKTSSTSTNQESVALSLKVYVSDLYSPCFEIPFGSGLASSEQMRTQAAELDAWYGRFRAIVTTSDQQPGNGKHPAAIEHTSPAPATAQLGWAGRTFGA